MVAGLSWKLRRQTGLRRKPLAGFPLFGDPSNLSLAPPKSQVSGLLLLQPCTRPSCEPHRSLAVVPLIPDKRYYGESPASLQGGSRPVRGGGRSGRQPVRGQRLACLGRRPGSAVSTKTPANGKGEGPSTVRPLTGARLRLAKSGRRLEFKLYLALAPSRHVSALRNLMLVLSTV